MQLGSAHDPARWLNHRDPMVWIADGEITAALTDPDMPFLLTPTGPIHQGIRTEVDLFAAALHVIPDARWAARCLGTHFPLLGRTSSTSSATSASSSTSTTSASSLRSRTSARTPVSVVHVFAGGRPGEDFRQGD